MKRQSALDRTAADPAINFKAIFDRLPTASAFLENRIIVACNQVFMQMMRGDESTLVGKSFEILYAAPEDFDVRGKRVEGVLRELGAYFDDRLLKRINGEIFWSHISGQTFDRRTPYKRAIWTFIDLSTQRHIQTQVHASLTQRERDVATLLLEKLTTKEIARRLAISPRTVDIHRGSLLRKYQVSSTSELLTSMLSN